VNVFHCVTQYLPLPGAKVADLNRFHKEFTAASGLPRSTVDRLLEMYGARAMDVWKVADDSPELLEPFDEGTGAIGAELIFAFREEFARTLTDVLMRRTMVGFGADLGLDSVERAAQILAQHLDWDSERVADEIEAYRRYVQRFDVPGRKEPVRGASGSGGSEEPTASNSDAEMLEP